MSGKLYALSSGPGAADLITVRAARILGQLDVLYAPAGRKGGDSLALSIVREYLGAHTEVRCCHFPMSADSAEKEAVWNDVAAALAQEVAAGRQVGFITLGDAMLFSTWVFLLQRIGCPDWLEIVPGVTSFAAIAARAKTPLAMEQQSLAVISCTAPEADIAAALRQHDSLVLMKVYGRFSRIKALLAQAGLLAHGGLTTLGANGMSMAVIGPMVGYLVWKLACRAGIRRDVGVFLCAMLADLMTYFVTSVQLGVAFPDPATGAGGSIAKFMGIFCLTQIPIAIAEGLLTVMIYDQLTKRRLIAAEGH